MKIDNFPACLDRCYSCAVMLPLRADGLLPQPLMEHSSTLVFIINGHNKFYAEKNN